MRRKVRERRNPTKIYNTKTKYIKQKKNIHFPPLKKRELMTMTMKKKMIILPQN